MTNERAKQLARSGIPNAEGIVVAARGKQAFVGAHRHRSDAGAVPDRFKRPRMNSGNRRGFADERLLTQRRAGLQINRLRLEIE
ncbi:MAG: hypothetical protein NTY19_29115 [Planctomycetota bacterium]|nr:hypothetical protein [Planctomycetota bacterium]